MPSTRRTAAIVVALLSILVIAAPTVAASPWVSFSQSGITAGADTFDCTENPDGSVTCSGESLFVFEGKVKATGEAPQHGEQVCYNRFTDTFDPITGDPIESESVFGCAFDSGTLSIDDLTSVTLDPTVIELVAFECEGFDCTETPAGSITVEATWTGVGPISKQTGKFRFDDGTCVQIDAQKAQSREASFDGSFEAQFAQLSEGSFTFRTNCAFVP